MSRAVSLIALLGSSLLAPSRAQGYCLQKFATLPGFVTWKQEVPYYVSDNVTDPAIAAAIDAAFQAWAAVPCTTFRVRKAGTFALGAQPFKGHGFGIYVYWHTTPDGYLVDPKFISHAFLSVEGEGDIVGGSIGVNAFSVSWGTAGQPDAFDVQGEMTERIGQVIGLETSNAPTSVMSRTLRFADLEKRTLKTDDINALTFLYGGPGCATPPPAPGQDGCAPPPAEQEPPPAPTPDLGPAHALEAGVLPSGLDAGTAPPAGDVGSMPLVGGPTRCAASEQCPGGQICGAEGYCVGGAGEHDGGCALAGPAGLSGFPMILAGLLLVRRRRR